MAKLSDSMMIRGNLIKNRIAMLPVVTFSFHGDGNDYFGRQHVEHYTKIAAGGAGIVCVQGTSALGAKKREGQLTPGSCETLREIAKIIKSYGAAAMIQLSWGGDPVTDLNALTTNEFAEKQNELLVGALLMHELGFDGVEFHFGHTFLLCKTIDAVQNRRADRFGGSPEKRVSVLTDILPYIRAHTPETFFVAVRMGAFYPNLEDGIAAAQAFEAAGVDLFDITFGMERPKEPAPESFPLSALAYSGYLIRQHVRVPVVGVGGLDTAEKAESLIENEYADIAGAAKAHLADYDFANKILSGNPLQVCMHCSKCFWYTDHTRCPSHKKETLL
ncbi:MAG: NADH:flavin oxidoreductase [Clostridiales Family XIII bacterium]|jgi:2,4-dienoyl-CoA reductase-like NADH-dependent reductase (Old Yellow Enzyme family)|nr:NADH:flavin oxidoreductase [Clostridiales Family XIII bacterium]